MPAVGFVVTHEEGRKNRCQTSHFCETKPIRKLYKYLIVINLHNKRGSWVADKAHVPCAKYFDFRISNFPKAHPSGQKFIPTILRAASCALALLLNAETRKNPSPCAPKPDPGVMTMFASSSMRSNISQLPIPGGVLTQI